MHLVEHQNLWNNIQQFVLDEPNATITFSKKLAGQQKWSVAYTERVIAEYRKFIFLCCISPKGASPSKPVDEAWHLHLTYTQSYWNEFCKKTLGRDLHHYPSNGGSQEDHKHTTWYDDTLKLYESVFGVQAPADIWPQSIEKHAPEDAPWVAPELQYLLLKDRVQNVAVLLVAPLVISLYFTGKFFPYTLNGEQFLYYYAMVVAVALIAFYLLQKKKLLYMKQTVDARFPTEVSVFQLAHFLYGKQRAIQTCLVDLYRRNLVSVNDKGKIVVHRNSYQEPAKEDNPLVPAMLIEAENSSVHYKAIADDWYKQKSFERPELEKLFSITDQTEPFFVEYLVVIIAFIIGIVRVFQGLQHGSPFDFLVTEIIFFIAGVVFILYKFSSKNFLFDKVEERMMEKAGDKSLHSDEVVGDFALNGKTVLDWLPKVLMLGTLFATFPVIRAPATAAERTLSPYRGDYRDKRWGNDDAGDSTCGSDSCGSSD